jgi:hypothetical protein
MIEKLVAMLAGLVRVFAREQGFHANVRSVEQIDEMRKARFFRGVVTR